MWNYMTVTVLLTGASISTSDVHMTITWQSHLLCYLWVADGLYYAQKFGIDRKKHSVISTTVSLEGNVWGVGACVWVCVWGKEMLSGCNHLEKQYCMDCLFLNHICIHFMHCSVHSKLGWSYRCIQKSGCSYEVSESYNWILSKSQVHWQFSYAVTVTQSWNCHSCWWKWLLLLVTLSQGHSALALGWLERVHHSTMYQVNDLTSSIVLD